MCCLQDRNEEQQAADPDFKFSVQFLNTFFWPKLVQGGHAGEPARLLFQTAHTAAQHQVKLSASALVVVWSFASSHVSTAFALLHVLLGTCSGALGSPAHLVVCPGGVLLNNVMQLCDANCGSLRPFNQPAVHHWLCKLHGYASLTAHLRCPAAVRRWTRKRHVLAADLILIPINHCNLHWCLATIATSAGTLSYFDSMGGKGSSGSAGHRVLATLEEWLMADAKDKQRALVSCHTELAACHLSVSVHMTLDTEPILLCPKH